MNEIERTIRELQLYVDARWGGRNDMLNLALTALREQAERSKGCEFCCYVEYPDEKLYPKEGYVFYAGFSKQVDVDTFDEDEVEKISYCPMCGRKLEEAPSDGGRI